MAKEKVDGWKKSVKLFHYHWYENNGNVNKFSTTFKDNEVAMRERLNKIHSNMLEQVKIDRNILDVEELETKLNELAHAFGWDTGAYEGYKNYNEDYATRSQLLLGRMLKDEIDPKKYVAGKSGSIYASTRKESLDATAERLKKLYGTTDWKVLGETKEWKSAISEASKEFNQLKGQYLESFLQLVIPYVQMDVDKAMEKIDKELQKKDKIKTVGTDIIERQVTIGDQNLTIKSQQKTDVSVAIPKGKEEFIANITAKNYADISKTDVHLLDNNALLIGLIADWGDLTPEHYYLSALTYYDYSEAENFIQTGRNLLAIQGLIGRKSDPTLSNIMIINNRSSAKPLKVISTYNLLTEAMKAGEKSSSFKDAFRFDYSSSKGKELIDKHTGQIWAPGQVNSNGTRNPEDRTPENINRTLAGMHLGIVMKRAFISNYIKTKKI